MPKAASSTAELCKSWDLGLGLRIHKNLRVVVPSAYLSTHLPHPFLPLQSDTARVFSLYITEVVNRTLFLGEERIIVGYVLKQKYENTLGKQWIDQTLSPADFRPVEGLGFTLAGGCPSRFGQCCTELLAQPQPCSVTLAVLALCQQVAPTG